MRDKFLSGNVVANEWCCGQDKDPCKSAIDENDYEIIGPGLH
jgi:hypothetical protein